jgi:sodium transport system permease protein
MKLSNIKTIYLKEMTECLRDRRTLISMIVVPVLLIPVLMIGMGSLTVKLMKQVEAEKAKVMIIGAERDQELVAQITSIERFQIVPFHPEYKTQIVDKQIRAAVEIPEKFSERILNGSQPEVPVYYYEGEIKSQSALRNIEQALTKYRKQLVRKQLEASNLSEKALEPFITKQTNVAPQEQVSGQRFGGLIPYMIILMCLTGAMYPAIDLTAGEKERGTIETILVSPASRMDIVLGKFFTVLTAAGATAVLSLSSLAFCLTIGMNYIIKSAGAKEAMVGFQVTPVAMLLVLLLMIPVAVLFSSALLAIALMARSFKEAQSYVSPLMILVILPAVASMLPGMELDLGLSFIPVLSSSLVIKEILTNVYHWNFIGVTFLVSSVYAGIALLVAFQMFNRESVLFRS